MAYTLSRPSSRWIALTLPANTTAVITAHAWINLTSLPTGDSYPNRFGLFARTGGVDANGYYSILRAGGLILGFTNGDYREHLASYTWTTATWRSVGLVWDFSSATAHLKTFVDGTEVGTTTSFTRGTVDNNSGHSVFGALFSSGVEAFDGEVGEAATWGVELAPADFAALAKGRSPARVRPQSLLRYWPLVRNTHEAKAGTSVALVNSPTVATHPRIYI